MTKDVGRSQDIRSCPRAWREGAPPLVLAAALASCLLLLTTCQSPLNSNLYSLASTNASIKVRGISLEPTSLSLTTGGTGQLKVVFDPDNATNTAVSWTTSNPSLVTVSSSGLVTAQSSSGGPVTVTATSQDGGFKADCTVTLVSANVPVASITVNPSTLNLMSGGTGQLSVLFNPSNATNQTVTWSTSNSSLATVSSTGLVTALAGTGGPVTITATSQDGSFVSSCTVSLTGSPVSLTGISLGSSSATIFVGGTATPTLTFTPSNATNTNVTWSTSNSSVASVDTAGIVTGLSAGTSTVTATSQDGGFMASWTITVQPATTSISLNTTSQLMTSGQTYQLSATVTPSGNAVSWTSSNTSVATVDQTGLVTAGGTPGSATMTATSASQTATCTIVIAAWQTPLGGGSIPSVTGAGLKMVVDSTGKPYVVYVDTGGAGQMMSFNGSSWVSNGSFAAQVATPNPTVSPYVTPPATGSGAGSNLSLAVDSSNNVYVAFPEIVASVRQLTVAQYSGSWTTLANPASSALTPSSGDPHYISLAIDGTTPYVSFADGGASNAFAATTIKYSAGSWTLVGSRGGTNAPELYLSLAIDPSTHNPILAAVNNNIFEAYDQAISTVIGFQSPLLTQPKDVSLAIDSTTKRYLALSDTGNSNRATVLSHNNTTGGSWVNVGTGVVSSGQASLTSLAIGAGNTPFLAFLDSANGNAVSVWKFDGTNWVSMGTNLSSGTIVDLTLAADPTGPGLYLAFADNSGVITVRRLQ